ncbi:MAG: hypothetical protein JJT94_03990 [Bernardetiaceae bacterium]|nr:hypothetical protein [Bernardetiaceae bacterium]
MAIHSRSWQSEGYRFGFNTQEKTPEIAPDTYTAEFWQYDSRVARRWNVDPVDKPWESSYAAFANNPIWFVDWAGNDTTFFPNKQNRKEAEKDKALKTFDSPEMMSEVVDVYWHEGSDKYSEGWYFSNEYKEILTGSSENNKPMFPLMVRLATRDILLNDKAEITKKDLSTDELIALGVLAKKSLQKGRKNIKYSDYKTHQGDNPFSDVSSIDADTPGESTFALIAKYNNPFYILKTSLGQASIIKEKGDFFVIDEYDFNNAPKARKNKSTWEKFSSYISGVGEAGLNPYKQVRNLGTYYGSMPGDGMKIKIKISKLLLK